MTQTGDKDYLPAAIVAAGVWLVELVAVVLVPTHVQDGHAEGPLAAGLGVRLTKFRSLTRHMFRMLTYTVKPWVALVQCCGSDKSFGSGFGSGSGLKLVSDSDLDQNFFFVLKFLPSLIFKHKKAAFPQLHDLATNKVRNKFAGFGSGSISKRHGYADTDPYQKVTDPQHCVQLHVNVFYCSAIVATTCQCEICIFIWNHLISAWK